MTTADKLFVQGFTPWSRSHFNGALVPAVVALQVCRLWSYLGRALVWSKAGSGCVGSGASWEGLWYGPRSAASCSGLRLLGRSYKVIYNWLPLCWAWDLLVGTMV